MNTNVRFYRCTFCGQLVSTLREGDDIPACCGQAMTLIHEHSVEDKKEKHLPVPVQTDGGVRVTIGEEKHPMIEKHYIEWIELEIDGRSYRQFLQPGEEPTALFPGHNGPRTFRAYCNIHGMWKTA